MREPQQYSNETAAQSASPLGDEGREVSNLFAKLECESRCLKQQISQRDWNDFVCCFFFFNNLRDFASFKKWNLRYENNVVVNISESVPHKSVDFVQCHARYSLFRGSPSCLLVCTFVNVSSYSNFLEPRATSDVKCTWAHLTGQECGWKIIWL